MKRIAGKWSKKRCFWFYGLLLTAWSAPACLAAPPQDTLGPINCAALRERLEVPRWLGLPMSRLVVNPFLGRYTGHDGMGGGMDGVLPVNLAYYVGAAPARLPDFWFLQLPGRSAASPGVVAGPRLALSDAGWQTQGVSAAFDGKSVRVTSTGDFGALSRTVTVDLDKTPYLVVQTPPGSPPFDLKVNSGSKPVDTFLRPAERLGAAAANVAAATGWHGVKTFQVLLYALGKSKPVTFTRVQFFGLPDLSVAPERNTWMPHLITSQVKLGPAGGLVDSAVTMPDAASVAQRLHIGPGGPSALTLAGRFVGSVRWDAARNTLLLQGDHLSAALTVSRKARWLGVQATQLDWMLGENQESRAASGVWRMALTGLKPGDDLIVAARFAPSAGALPLVRDAVRALATPARFTAAAAQNEAAWDRRLASVPRPLDFTPRRVGAKGVTAADMRRAYYRAWVFFWQDTLPPMPENGFPYPQVCTGKPSLWGDGGTHIEATALWDASAAMQALALVEPHPVWTAAQGVMSQVEADGYLNGEALPTIVSRTLWLLYQQTGDIAALRVTYPALKRFLVWKIANPRWIYPNRTQPTADPNAPKDQEFVSHEIVDLDYAIRIANALGMPREAATWRQKQQAAAADYQHWFWPAPGGHVYLIYTSDIHRAAPDNPWSLQGLQISRSLLPPYDAAALAALYKKTMNPALPFLVPGRTRFGDLNPITLGLFRHGQLTEAARLADACLRDVTRAGDFSENYTQSSPPVPGGVRPSAFGARLMVDSAFWHNGVVLDEGFPVLLGMPGAVGVDNIPVHGDPISIRFGGAAHTVTLQGPGLAHLRLPDGFQVVEDRKGVPRWRGTVELGRQIRLEGRP